VSSELLSAQARWLETVRAYDAAKVSGDALTVTDADQHRLCRAADIERDLGDWLRKVRNTCAGCGLRCEPGTKCGTCGKENGK
jgi:hypothetical protein